MNSLMTVLNPGLRYWVNESNTESETQETYLDGAESETETQAWPKRY